MSIIHYYKITEPAEVLGIPTTYILGVGTSESMRRYQSRYGLIEISDENNAEMIEADLSGELYTAPWMRQERSRLAKMANVEEITEQEYLEIRKKLADASAPLEIEQPDQDPEQDGQPEPEESVFQLTTADLLEMVADLQTRVCLLELGITPEEVDMDGL